MFRGQLPLGWEFKNLPKKVIWKLEELSSWSLAQDHRIPAHSASMESSSQVMLTDDRTGKGTRWWPPTAAPQPQAPASVQARALTKPLPQWDTTAPIYSLRRRASPGCVFPSVSASG